MDWKEVVDALASIRTLCRIISPLDLEIHLDGLRLAERYSFSFFDALMIASAMRLGCVAFWSEDMQNGMIVDERITVLDPFRNDATKLR